ncbi:hypothetical protein BELL_0036g00020 [Botrytis elliptica]|uniref:Uncharacterized protein n=1 Tax=Botrytis elliptica TaxID=278938 RepID=A0A4Z1K1E3_9HELO|nr:hypothetical protein EAE99_002847 [Botrytis elliptica]TGO79314.1 hypothetical protein BELL_0036g00020 [Botrytis elliptica]
MRDRASPEKIILATKSQRKDRECKMPVSRHENKPPALASHGKSNKPSKPQLKWDHEMAYKAGIFSRKYRQCKTKPRGAQDLHGQASQKENRVPPPNWKTKYPQYTYKTGAPFKPPRTSGLNVQNWLMVRLESEWEGHMITVHPLDWEEFEANEKDGHRLLTSAINFIRYWDQYIKDNPKDLKDMDQIFASWVASSCTGDNPYRAKLKVGDPRLLDYSHRRRQLQRMKEKKWQHMQRTKERQEKFEKLSMIDDQIKELTLRVGRPQFF